MKANSRTVIIYSSKYGSTETYATWIRDELECDIIKYSEANKELINNYEIIILGGYLCLRNFKDIDIIKENLDKFKNKKIIIFCTGALKDGNKILDDILKKELDNFNNIKVFYLRGAYNYQNLYITDKILIKGFISVLKRKNYDELDDVSKEILYFNDKKITG